MVYFLEKYPGRRCSRVRISSISGRECCVGGCGNTVHLCIFAPELAALENHPDTIDIVVLQLIGLKEWLLCDVKKAFHLPYSTFSTKLKTCSTYQDTENEQMLESRSRTLDSRTNPAIGTLLIPSPKNVLPVLTTLQLSPEPGFNFKRRQSGFTSADAFFVIPTNRLEVESRLRRKQESLCKPLCSLYRQTSERKNGDD